MRLMNEPVLHHARGFRLPAFPDQQSGQGVVARDVVWRLPQAFAVGLFRSGQIGLVLVTLANVVDQVCVARPKLQGGLKIPLSRGEISLLIEAESIRGGNASAVFLRGGTAQ